MVEVTTADEAMADAISMFCGPGMDFDGVIKQLAAHRTAHEAPLKARIAELEEALKGIEAEMAFPNQLEAGFVHGKPTYQDLSSRVGIAILIAHAALKGQTNDQ